MLIETSTVLPNTLEFINFDTSRLSYQPQGNTFKITNLTNAPIQLSFSYRVARFDLVDSGAIIDSSDIDQELRLKLIGADYDVEDYTARRIIQSNKLEYSGSFSRGVSFGNAQDVVLNSNFNMQLLGDLGNGLSVRAAISDESIPIQPEGNTQVLQEFDKIFIEVEKNRTALVAGDYELSRPDSYFMNYYKKLKGISLRTTQDLGNNWRTYNKGSFAVSRGKFRRQILEIREGNQGPYRLTGADNEIFLQVLSGTEKVFADGQLLKRGETNDYVIDYNRAEIRFTANRVITDNLRIIVEFEYAVQSYLRSLYATETVIENDNTSFKINLYNEQDSKSLANNLELDSTDLRILNQGGNEELFTSGVFSISPETSSDIIRYNNTNQNFLVYEPEDSINVVGAIFSNVGNNNGSYIIDTEAGANGRVYKYVGDRMGTYDPLIRLIAPERRQLITFSASHRLADSTSVYIESGISNNDLNRFSDIGNDQNVGLSLFGKINDYRRIKGKWTLQTNANIELAQKNFRALNPYRAPEFVRDWNISDIEGDENERLFDSSFKLANESSYIKYSLSGFNEDFLYNGIKHRGEAQYQNKTWFVNLIGDWLESESTIERTFFSRPRATVKKSFLENKLTLGTYFEKERNVRRNIADNSLISTSFNYDLNRIFAESNVSENLQLRLGYSRRTDEAFANGELNKSTIADNYELGGLWNKGAHSTLQWQLTYRTFNVEEEFLNTKSPKKAFIGNLDHKLKILNNGVTLNTFYESTSGQEPKIEFQYIRVQDGEGSYQWIDYNQDSIQQVTEFEVSNFSDEGQYERITVFNNEFISTNRNVVNQALKIEPQRFLKNKKNWLSKFVFTSRYRVDEKSLNEGDNSVLRFVNFNFRDTSLVAFNSSFDHNIFFNRGNPAYDIQLAYRSLNNKIRQISGSELRLSDQYYSRVRFNLRKKLDAIIEGTIGQKERESENFSNQNFLIDFWNLSPQLNYRPSTKMRNRTQI